MNIRTGYGVHEIREAFLNNLFYVQGKNCRTATRNDRYIALAYTVRDRLMERYHLDYPHYGFDRHKGYPTKIHLQALESLGVSPIHRRSFGPVRRLLKSELGRVHGTHADHLQAGCGQPDAGRTDSHAL